MMLMKKKPLLPCELGEDKYAVAAVGSASISDSANYHKGICDVTIKFTKPPGPFSEIRFKNARVRWPGTGNSVEF